MPEDATPQTPDPTSPDTVEPDYKADADKWKAMSRKWEQRAKENEAAAQKLTSLEEAQKTAEQKAADKAAEAEQRAREAEVKVLRYEVGVEKKVPPQLLRYLTGSTKEELEANADQLIADFGADTGPENAASSGRPKEALRPGAAPDANPEPAKAINDRIRQAARGRS